MKKPLTIFTIYYDMEGREIRINKGNDANRAVATCTLHMQINHYGAKVAQVYDSRTGELHAEITRSIKNAQLKITYKRDPMKFETRFAKFNPFGGMSAKPVIEKA